jgi:hypothetical protein
LLITTLWTGSDAYRLAAALKEGAHSSVQLFDAHRHLEDFGGLICSTELWSTSNCWMAGVRRSLCTHAKARRSWKQIVEVFWRCSVELWWGWWEVHYRLKSRVWRTFCGSFHSTKAPFRNVALMPKSVMQARDSLSI